MDIIEQKILAAIDHRAEELLAFAEDIYRHPEPGYRESRTAGQIAGLLTREGLEPEKGLAVTGVKARLSGRGEPRGKVHTVALIGELDAIACPRHPDADPSTGVAHACGHHAQLAAVAGAAMALCDPEVADALCGDVVFFAVPAEEYTDLDYKAGLMHEGVIRYGGGKSELVRIGAFDDVDIAVNHHLHVLPQGEDLLLGNNPTNGFVLKKIIYEGKAAHAAISPHEGVNALNAAALGLSALAYQRETFREKDTVRVHGIITHGGDVTNVVPDHVELEAQVRAGNLEAMLDAAKKADRAFEAGAHAVGGRVVIRNYPGFLPILPFQTPPCALRAGEALKDRYRVGCVDLAVRNCASTDVGDLSHLMPVLGLNTFGFTGALHSADFRVTDPDVACLLPAKAMALTAYHLLRDGARGAGELLAGFRPAFTKEEYLEYLEQFSNVSTYGGAH